jgi:hypothetical protein
LLTVYRPQCAAKQTGLACIIKGEDQQRAEYYLQPAEEIQQIRPMDTEEDQTNDEQNQQTRKMDTEKHQTNDEQN